MQLTTYALIGAGKTNEGVTGPICQNEKIPLQFNIAIQSRE